MSFWRHDPFDDFMGWPFVGRPRYQRPLIDYLFTVDPASQESQDVEMEDKEGEGSKNESQMVEHEGDKKRKWSGWMIQPRADVMEAEDKSLIISLDLPGVKKEDIDIKLEKGILTLSAERKEVEVKEGDKWHRRETRQGKYQRSFAVPDGLNPEDVKAAFEDGILKVTLPKPEAAKQEVHKITIT